MFYKMYHYIVILHVGGYVVNFPVDTVIDNSVDSPNKINELARNILHTNIMYLKASADIKNSTFLEKNGGLSLWITKWTFKINGPVFGHNRTSTTF